MQEIIAVVYSFKQLNRVVYRTRQRFKRLYCLVETFDSKLSFFGIVWIVPKFGRQSLFA